MNALTLSEPRKHTFTGKRYPCPECGSSDGFARADGRTDTGKCHSCGAWIEPKRDDSSKKDDGILRTKQGSAINLRLYKNRQDGTEHDDKKEIPRDEIMRSFEYLRRCRECDEFEERAAILEIENGLTRTEADTEAGVIGLCDNNPNTFMLRIIEEETTLLRSESPFAATITELTQTTILSEWHVGLSSDGAIIFWYVDHTGRFRNAKKIWYGPNGWNRRDDKNPFFMYKGFFIPIYGEWQLTPQEHRPFALFESEKTAIVASVHMPQYVCLAVGGHNLTDDRKASVLRGRTGIILFDREPQTIQAAEQAAQTIRKIGGSVTVENLESFYPGIPANWDAADIIYNQFQEWQQKQPLQ